jgi:hypothetical protein
MDRDFARELYQRLYNETANELGALWDSVSEKDRELLGRVLKRVAELQLAEISGNGRNDREWAHADAQLLNIKSAGEGRARHAVFAVLRRIFSRVLELLGAG